MEVAVAAGVGDDCGVGGKGGTAVASGVNVGGSAPEVETGRTTSGTVGVGVG